MTPDLAELVGDLEFDPDEIDRRYAVERDRRLRPEGRAQYAEATGKFAQFNRDPWVAPGFQRPPILDHTSVIVAGGGWGGLLIGARLHQAGIVDVRIIDEAGDFGGTWYWNRYPGAMCDIEAHIYLPLLEELHYAPKHRYSLAPEMFEHAQRIGHNYGLYDKACFQTSITDAVWLEDEQRWLVRTDRDDRMTADFLVLACGRQSLPKLPNISGISDFKGHMFHSSRWDYSYTGGDSKGNLTGLLDKKVGIVGTGASAIQIVPEVAAWAKEVHVFQRTPSTVGVRANRETGPDWVDMSVPGWQQRRRENFQALILGQETDVDEVADGWTETLGRLTEFMPHKLASRLGRKPAPEEGGLLAKIADHRVMNSLRTRIEEVVGDADAAEVLKPWYRFRCKRPCFHDDYLEAFNRPNVGLVDTSGTGIQRLDPDAVVVGDKRFEVDCLIFATGFEAGITYTHLTGFDLTGRDGLNLSEHWGSGVRTLHGTMTDSFPNLLFVGGNQHSAVAVNAVHLLDEQSKHVAHIIAAARDCGAAAVEPTSTAVDEYTKIINDSPKQQAEVEFFADCTPGYFNLEGKATKGTDLFAGARYPDGPLAFYQLLETWRKDGRCPGLAFVRETRMEPAGDPAPARARSAPEAPLFDI